MKTYRIFTAVAALVALAACQNEETEYGGFASDPNAVHIRASIGDMITRSNPVGTDATYFNVGDEISIKTDNQSAVVYVLGADRSTWTPKGSEYLKWYNQNQVFSAIYPASAANGFTVPTDQSTVEKIALADHMTFSDECSKGDDKSVSLTMKRQTARVIINNEVSWGDQYLDEKGTATHRIAELKVYNGSQKVTPCLYNNDWYALVKPMSKMVINEPFVSITIEPLGGGTSETLLIKNIPELKAGYSYSYSLHIGKDVVTFADVTVDEWSTTSPVDGTADEVVELHIENPGDLVNTPDAYALIDNALRPEGILKVTGYPSAEDLYKIRDWSFGETIATDNTSPVSTPEDDKNLLTLDLSEVTFVDNAVPKKMMYYDNKANGSYIEASPSKLQKVILPKTVTAIGQWAFYKCISLTEINLPANLTSIEAYAFSQTALAADINLPELTSIGYSVFSHSNVASAVFGKLTKIEDWVFTFCPALTMVSLPNVTQLESCLFQESTALQTLKLTAKGTISLNQNLSPFAHLNTANVDLWLHEDKKPGGTLGQQVGDDGKTWADLTWKSITYVNDNGEAFNYTYDASKRTYTVYTAKGLQEVNTLVAKNLWANITLANDIDMSSIPDGESHWTPLGGLVNNYLIDYKGTFDGNGKTIKNLRIETEKTEIGLIGWLNERGVVKNLSLRNCTVHGSSYVGCVVGVNYGTVEGCSTTNCYVSAPKIEVGCIVGNNYGKVYGCYAEGSEVSCKSFGGGIVGYNGTNGEITACGAIKVTIYVTDERNFGGITAYNTNTTVRGCYSYMCTACASTEDNVNLFDNNLGKYITTNKAGTTESPGGTVTQCYYSYNSAAAPKPIFAGFDSTSSPETSWGDSNSGAVKAMNDAIDASTATRCYHWGGTQDNPTLTKIE